MSDADKVIDPGHLATVAKPFQEKFVEGVMQAGFNPTGCIVYFFGSRLTGRTRDGDRLAPRHRSALLTPQ